MIVNPEPLTYNSVKNILSLLRKEYDFAGYEVIGRSWTGKAVFSLSIGDGNEKVLFLGGMRGKEQITTLLLLRFFERMCDAVKNDKKISAVKIRKSLQNRKITIVPLVSPDALDIAAKRADGAGVYAGLVARAAKGDYSKWNANARGVDISRNFNFPVFFRSGTAALRRTRARERTRDKGSSESLRSRAFQICVLPHRRRRKNILERTEGQSLGDSHDGKGALVGQRISALPQGGKREARKLLRMVRRTASQTCI